MYRKLKNQLFEKINDIDKSLVKVTERKDAKIISFKLT